LSIIQELYLPYKGSGKHRLIRCGKK
jgi:hypothetical protein